MNVLRRLIAADEAQETRVFLFMAVFGVVVAAIYWFVSYEAAGTAMLGGFGLATGVIGLRLAVDPASKRLREARSRERVLGGHGGRGGSGPPEVPEKDVPGGGEGGVDRPFLDESGRLPDETIAPFAVGIGLAVAATGLIFGPAPLIVGVLPLAWGAWAWLTAAGEEHVAAERDDAFR